MRSTTLDTYAEWHANLNPARRKALFEQLFNGAES